MSENKGRRKVEIPGLVLPGSWRTPEGVLDLVFHGYNETEFWIRDTEVGVRVASLVGRPVVLAGLVEDLDGESVLEVTDFSVLCSEEDGVGARRLPKKSRKSERKPRRSEWREWE